MTTSTFNDRDIARRLQSHLEGNVDRARLELQGAINRTLRRGTRSGETYYVPGTRQTYVASAPGEPPANRTGLYADSIESVREGLVAGVGTRDKRGRWLELGTSKMEPRPHFVPTAQSSLGRIKALLARELT